MNDREQLNNIPDTDISSLYQVFETSVGPSPKRILLLGCNDKEIANHFIKNGYKIYIINVSEQLIRFAKRNKIRNPLSFLIPHLDYKNAFDGIWVYTSFLDLVENRIKEALARCNIALKKNGIIFVSFRYKDINEETIKPYLRVSGFNILEAIITDEWFNVVLTKVGKPTYEYKKSRYERPRIPRDRASMSPKIARPKNDFQYSLVTGPSLPQKESSKDLTLHKFGPYNPNPTDPDYKPPATINYLLTSEQKIIKGHNFVLDFHLFTDEYRSTIEKIVSSSFSTTIKEGAINGIDNNCGISIVLSSPDIPSINDEDKYKWDGTFHTSNLSGIIPDDYQRDEFLITIDVVVDGIRISRIKSNININDNNTGELIFNRSDVKRVFFSYTSKDRAIVYNIVGRIRRAFNNDIDFFLDVLSLRAGAEWEQRLYKEIDDRDTFCLIWSKHACKSEWVDREWRYALEHKGLSSFSPINLDANNKKVPIPDELQSIHFACYPMIFK